MLNAEHSGKRPLEGIRIVDFSWVVAGPMTTKMLGAMGAEVIKIESDSRPEHAQRGGIFRILNNNKRSATFDIRTEEGQALLHRLVAVSDVVVENFSARVLQSNRLGYAELSAIKPDLIYVSASGVGRTGPQRDALAYGTLLQAYSGRGRLIGEPNERIEAMGILPIWTDPITAMWETFAVLSAIYHRRRTGAGSYVDLSMLEATVALLPEALLRLSTGIGGRGPGGSHDGASAPCGCFRSRGDDAWIALAITSDDEWARLCALLERPDLHKAYPSADTRLTARETLNAVVADWSRDRSANEAVDRLRASGVPAALTRSFDAVMADEAIVRRGVFTTLPDGSQTYSLPWRDADTGWRGAQVPPPALGADNQYVFRELLGLTEGDYERLFETVPAE